MSSIPHKAECRQNIFEWTDFDGGYGLNMSFLRKIALIYDPWSLGLSDGLPRNEIYPSKQAEDYSDALSYLSSLPMVDSSSIAFWRMSFSATVALCAAALDKRASLIIAVCPFLNFELTAAKFPKVLVKCINNRES